MAIEIVFETHSPTVDNDEGRATGWLPGELPPRGRELAAELGRRRRDDGIAAVFCSDLPRAAQTASIAFGPSGIPVLHDWRQAITRVGRFLADLSLRWDGQRVLVVGHVATRWGLEHYLTGAVR